ncbi:nuclear receptor subfamily 2 group E member 1-like, partial [Caligus rogercresseyi]
ESGLIDIVHFFQRSIRRNRIYVCKAKSEGSCLVDKTHRNQCRACRLKRCVEVAGAPKPTLRRQMSLYFKEHSHNNTTAVSSESGSPRSSPPINPGGLPVVVSSAASSPPLLFTTVSLLQAAAPLSPCGLSLGSSPSPCPPTPFSPLHHHHHHHTPLENVSETAARLLFMNVKWAQNILLLEDSWRELFLLSSAQFNLPIELAASPDKSLAVLGELKAFQEALVKFQAMAVDTTEYACIRAIETRDSSISALQDQAQLTLSKYIATAYPGQPMRFGKLLLLLPSLRSVSGGVIEEPLLQEDHWAIPIERIICDMFKAGQI